MEDCGKPVICYFYLVTLGEADVDETLKVKLNLHARNYFGFLQYVRVIKHCTSGV